MRGSRIWQGQMDPGLNPGQERRLLCPCYCLFSLGWGRFGCYELSSVCFWVLKGIQVTGHRDAQGEDTGAKHSRGSCKGQSAVLETLPT